MSLSLICLQRADVVIAPLTITYEREQFVDFTKPFMDLGLLVLMAKKTSGAKIFSFLDPFELQLWIACGVSLIIFGFTTACCSFCSPYGSRGKYTQRLDKKSDKYKDGQKTFSIWNSMWYTYGSWTTQVIFLNIESGISI